MPRPPSLNDDESCLDHGVNGLTIRPTAFHSYAKPEMALRFRDGCAEVNLERMLKCRLNGLQVGARVHAWVAWVDHASSCRSSLEDALDFGSNGSRLPVVSDEKGNAEFDFKLSKRVFHGKAGTLRRPMRLCVEVRGAGVTRTILSHPFKVLSKFHDSGSGTVLQPVLVRGLSNAAGHCNACPPAPVPVSRVPA